MEITKEKIQNICRGELIDRWNKQPKTAPTFLYTTDCYQEVSYEQKLINEQLFDTLVGEMRRLFTKNPKGIKQETAWIGEVELALNQFLQQERILDIGKHLSAETFEEIRHVVKLFIRRTREFDENLNFNQLWQAMRNYLIYCMIVRMQNREQNANIPVWAYSLLYPYTDNYIDDPSRTHDEKKHFNQLIADKIEEKTVFPVTDIEKRTCKLLDGILDEYSKKSSLKPSIQIILLSLLEAQGCSMGQQEQMGDLETILRISAWKGGTSVLADYLFACDEWTEDEVLFYLQFGLVLQLVDDLQDIVMDEKEGSHTLMTEGKHCGQLEEVVNQLLWFTDTSIDQFACPLESIKPFVRIQCVGVTLLAIGMNQDLFDSSYLNEIEKYLPFTLTYLKKFGKKPKDSGVQVKASGADRMKLIGLMARE